MHGAVNKLITKISEDFRRISEYCPKAREDDIKLTYMGLGEYLPRQSRGKYPPIFT